MISRLAPAAVLLHSLAAQAPLAFEVTTIKPGDPRSGVVAAQRFSARRFEATGSLHAFIKVAYGIQDFQIVGGPKWVTADTFDISAQADQAVSAAQMKLMLRTLLAERFRLAVHTEKRPLPAFALVVDKGGLRVKPADGTQGSSSGRNFIRGQMTLTELGNSLSPLLGRAVQDETGVAGSFDIRLEWALDEDSSAPSLFTAVREQLGLRLDAVTRPLDVWVIDHAEKPSAN